MRFQRDSMASRLEALKLDGMATPGPLLAGTAAPRIGPGAAWPGTVAEIERIVRAKGTVSNGVLNIEIDREDLPHVRKAGVPVKPAFEINGNLCFQQLSDGSIAFNGDLCVKPEELNPAIDQMVKHGLTWQAMHQHLWGLEPMVGFMHMRARGSARQIAEGCAAVLGATSTPLPQAPPENPATPLDAKRLAKIIGAVPSVGASGVVTFELPQREPVTLGGVRINPFLNVYTSVAFQPLGGDKAAAVPDFGLLAHQVDPVARLMRGQGWEIDCLCNQETAEQPQLYFSHQFKVGDAYALATEIRRGLELTSVKFQ
jgi:uncharacterized protein DUF1259